MGSLCTQDAAGVWPILMGGGWPKGPWRVWGREGLTWKAFMWEVGARNQRSSPAVFVRRRRMPAFCFSSCDAAESPLLLRHHRQRLHRW